MSVRDSFRDQATACRELGSPFTADLLELCAERLSEDDPVGSQVLHWTGNPGGKADALALRLAGALHALAMSGRAGLAAVYPPHRADTETLWRVVEAAFRDEAAFIFDRLTLPPQTNEVRRAGALFPSLMAVAAHTGLPLVLSELGASAGLNLRMDGFSYDLGGVAAGDPGSSVRISPTWEGPAPHPEPVRIVARAGCDLSPLDPRDPADAERLKSYVWADQPDRLERTAAAIEICRRDTVTVGRMDAVRFLEERLAELHPGAAHVIFHSVAWQYLPADDRAKGRDLIERAGTRATEDRPIAWLRMEQDGKSPGAGLALSLWPGPVDVEIGRADFHGRWVQWTGLPGQSLR